MSELKVYHCNEWRNEYTEFYLKSEADKVIADLEEKLKNSRNARKYWMKEYSLEHKECIRHKYKRCLAVAKWCEFYADSLRVKRNQCRYDEAELAETYYIRCRRYRRWCKVWMELAEKFKEAK